jgi:TolA-binding protein
VYTVKLSIQDGERSLEMVNRVAVDSPLLTPKDRQHTLDEYLGIVASYDPRTLDAAALRQLALAYEAKALLLEAKEEDDRRLAEENESRMSDKARVAARAKRLAAGPAESARYFLKAVSVVQKGLAGEPPPAGNPATQDYDLLRVAKLAGSMARQRLRASESALRIYQGAARRVQDAAVRAECEIEAADVALNDLLDVTTAKAAIEAAASHLGQGRTGPVAVMLQRVRGDYAAATGDGRAAQKAYREAEATLGQAGDYARRTARRGAHGRSVEEFLKSGQLDRAAAELHDWQQDFPADKIDGYLTLLSARCMANRKQYPQAIAQAERLQTVNADSPYVDQALYLAADCELKRGDRARSLAILHSIEKDYPGSPLIPTIKQAIAVLEQGEKE